MNKLYHLSAYIVALLLVLSACNNNTTKEEKAATVKKDSAAQNVKINNVTDSSLSLKARFANFQLGDASHFIFTDEKGNEWDFADNQDNNFKFAIELPGDKANEQNQGFASNKELVGKWFTIRYVYKLQPQYQDGPMAKVPVIIEAVLAK